MRLAQDYAVIDFALSVFQGCEVTWDYFLAEKGDPWLTWCQLQHQQVSEQVRLICARLWEKPLDKQLCKYPLPWEGGQPLPNILYENIVSTFWMKVGDGYVHMNWPTVTDEIPRIKIRDSSFVKFICEHASSLFCVLSLSSCSQTAINQAPALNERRTVFLGFCSSFYFRAHDTIIVEHRFLQEAEGRGWLRWQISTRWSIICLGFLVY